MPNQPLVSIIMPVYGVEKYISECIQSVLNQQYTNWELLVINDGTKDRSREIALSYSERDSRITILDKKNGGLSDARNYGLQFVKGKYIHFLDSDDWIEPTLYSNLICKIEKDGTDFLAFGYFVDTLDENGQFVSRKKADSYDLTYPYFDRNLFVLKLDHLLNFAWNKIFRTSFIQKNNLQYQKGLSLIEDIEFSSRAFPLARQVIFCSNAEYHYMNRPRVTLSQYYDDKMIDLCEQKIVLYNQLMICLGVDKDLLSKRCQQLAFGSFTFVLYSLFSHCIPNYQFVKNEVNKILAQKELLSLMEKYEPRSPMERLFKLLLNHKCSNLIILIYCIKHRKFL